MRRVTAIYRDRDARVMHDTNTGIGNQRTRNESAACDQNRPVRNKNHIANKLGGPRRGWNAFFGDDVRSVRCHAAQSDEPHIRRGSLKTTPPAEKHSVRTHSEAAKLLAVAAAKRGRLLVFHRNR